MKTPNTLQLAVSCGFLALIASPSAPGVLTHIPDQADDFAHCDPLLIPDFVHEIGMGFPLDELLFAADTGTEAVACVASNIQGIFDPIVEIINLTGRDWDEVW